MRFLKKKPANKKLGIQRTITKQLEELQTEKNAEIRKLKLELENTENHCHNLKKDKDVLRREIEELRA